MRIHDCLADLYVKDRGQECRGYIHSLNPHFPEFDALSEESHSQLSNPEYSDVPSSQHILVAWPNKLPWKAQTAFPTTEFHSQLKQETLETRRVS